ncbi:MAG TPA: hypothetical protein VH020_09230 [Stellaceae bacterium]|jgi:hypothetical protein|nr:hypothetical protein [Stellaceae bacterium]
MSAWRDIKDAPKDETAVLLWISGAPVVGFFGAGANAGTDQPNRKTWRVSWDHTRLLAPTVWQPIEPPPGHEVSPSNPDPPAAVA